MVVFFLALNEPSLHKKCLFYVTEKEQKSRMVKSGWDKHHFSPFSVREDKQLRCSSGIPFFIFEIQTKIKLGSLSHKVCKDNLYIY